MTAKPDYVEIKEEQRQVRNMWEIRKLEGNWKNKERNYKLKT